ncbi:MAG: hypothetical protein Q7T33_08720 [Dehalococcoidia bacterium]|nr:hypothetical protein [Dehalococcoidia bacterium]
MFLTRVALALGTLVLGGLAAAVIGLVVIALLASSGGSGPADACRPAGSSDDGSLRPVARDVETAAVFQQRWDDLRFRALSGSPTLSATFSEGEVTARASQYLAERDAPLQDIVICFHDGQAEARARAEVPTLADVPLLGGLFDTNVRLVGSIDLSGEHPRLKIEQLEAGNLPGFLEDAVRDEVEDAVNSRLTDLQVDLSYSVTFREGEAEVAVSP